MTGNMLHRMTAVAETVPLVLWLRLLLLSAASSHIISEESDHLYGISAEFSPKEPLFASGSTMQLNGTLILRNATPGVTAHQVHCTFDDANLTVDVLDNVTFQIRHENVTRQMSHGHVFCYVGRTMKLPQVVIRVADIPVAPNITSCVVDNWETMLCTWEMPKQETGLPTNYTLGWTLLAGSDLHPCNCPDRQLKDTCLWIQSLECDVFKMDMPYQMRMIAENELKKVYSRLFKFETTNLVKPRPVWNLHSTNRMSQSVELSWAWGNNSHDDNSRPLLYRVNYASEWDKGTINTSSKYTVLSGLVPNTKYKISVECLPNKDNSSKGFWSKETVISVDTLEDVPGRAPAFADGSYSSTTNNAVSVFWQPVPRRWLQGTLQQYRIRCFVYGNNSDVLTEKFEHRSDRTHSDLSVQHERHPYLAVTVEAETTVGYNSSLDLDTLVIPRADLAPAKPGIVHAVRNQSEISVMWSSVSNVSSYTVYWCKKTVHGQECETPLNWISVSPDVTSLSISVGSIRHDEFRIAVSVEMYVDALERNISSGVMWAGCVPDISKDVMPPQSVDFAKEQQAFSLTVEWIRPKCEDTAYIVKFEILYCQMQGCGEDGACCNNRSMFVENNETLKHETLKAVIRDLSADIQYKVFMRSISFTKNSIYVPTSSSRDVFRSGLTAGVVAAIVIAAIVLFLLLVVGLVTIAKKIKKCFNCCEPVQFKSPPIMRMTNGQTEGSQVVYNIHPESEEQKSLLHGGIGDRQEMQDAVIIRRNGEDYRHPNMSKSFQSLVGENGTRLPGRDNPGVPPHDSGISSYTHLAVPDESDTHATHKEPNGSVEIGHVTNPSSDRASHVLPHIAHDHPSDVEPSASVTKPYMPVDKVSLPVGSASSSTIAPYTTVEQTFEMAEPRNFPESSGYLPAIADDDAVQQVETSAGDCHNVKPDDYLRVQCPIDDYISGSLAVVSNVPGDPLNKTVNDTEFVAEVRPLYANHEMPISEEDGYSDQRDIADGTSPLKPLLPVGYIPLAPTLST